MNKLLLIIIFFLLSCTSNTTINDFNFSDEMSFTEYASKLDDYAINSPYPNIDD
jgi:hypothetical protein